MHPASGGHGLNLQAGGHRIIWFGQTYSLELEQQFNARLDRQGQKEVVIVNKLVCSKTVDQDVIRAQKAKTRGQDALMEAVKARVEKYMKNIAKHRSICSRSITFVIQTKRYYYELMDEDYNSYEAAIPDGRIKARAIAQAKRAMRDLGIRRALLVVNSMRTSNILDIITVELD